MAYFNPFRPAYVEDPYPALATLRSQEPVHRSRELGAWVVTSYEHTERALRDDDAFSSDPAHANSELGAAIRERRGRSPLGAAPIMGNSDPPAHTRLRTVVNRAFVPRAIEGMRPRIEAVAREILGQAPTAGIEVMSQFAEYLVVSVVLDHIGIPDADRTEVRTWAMAVMQARAEDGDPAVRAAAETARDELARYIESGEDSGRTTVVSAIRAAAADGERLSADEMVMLLAHVSLAGNGPTAYALGNAALHLGTHPEQLERLHGDRTLIPGAVEELFRFDSPTHLVARFALTNTTLGGRSIHAGDTVYAVIGAANRDPARFDRPDEFDVLRQDTRHLSFGHGIHFCLGAPLARLELAIAIGALIDRYGTFRTVRADRGGNLFTRGPSAVVIENGA